MKLSNAKDVISYDTFIGHLFSFTNHVFVPLDSFGALDAFAALETFGRLLSLEVKFLTDLLKTCHTLFRIDKAQMEAPCVNNSAEEYAKECLQELLTEYKIATSVISARYTIWTLEYMQRQVESHLEPNSFGKMQVENEVEELVMEMTHSRL
ncbi:hypothetical protein CR513_03342, partial [Mucuna pruriens]